ncbi:dienelactone hydrolase family protein [Pedobacter sp. PAMC26386]|nr:dienelactone hydrolase family protein [Pedobacter sp. PAMC26386]
MHKCQYKYILLTYLLSVMGFHLFAQTKLKVNYKHLLYLPKSYANDSLKYPLIIYLHGGSQKGNDLSKLKSYGLPFLVDKGVDFDFVIAWPQCPEGKYWSTENWLDSLYNDLLLNYRIDKNRVYVTGISMGGYGTYIAAMDHPEKIAAIVPLCGGINDNDSSRVCLLKSVPIWTFHGTIDDQISIKETERIQSSLKKCGGEMIFTRLEGEGHGIQYLYETNIEIYDWLLKHKRN